MSSSVDATLPTLYTEELGLVLLYSSYNADIGGTETADVAWLCHGLSVASTSLRLPTSEPLYAIASAFNTSCQHSADGRPSQ